MSTSTIALVRDVQITTADIYREHVQTVARWVGWLAGPELDVDDLIQEIFLRVHRLLPQFRGEARVTTWLYAITENVVLSKRRRERFRRAFRSRRDVDDLDVPAGEPTPLEDLEQRRSTALVRAALDGMPEKYRSILVLFELEGLPGREVAELMGLKIETLWVQLNRARTQLGSRIEELERRGRARR